MVGSVLLGEPNVVVVVVGGVVLFFMGGFGGGGLGWGFYFIIILMLMMIVVFCLLKNWIYKGHGMYYPGTCKITLAANRKA